MPETISKRFSTQNRNLSKVCRVRSHSLNHFKSLLAVVVIFSTLFIDSNAQNTKTIRGTVTDASTAETLPSANILIEGTYRGTISNVNGVYRLVIPDTLLPATVTVRYLGFESERRTITNNSNPVQDFALQPATLQLGEVIVTGEDPAIRIMREVIRRKQQWRKALDTYKAEAYTRQTVSNDTSIVMITESVSTSFWDKERGHREVLLSRRQTANMEASENFAGVSYLPNFYDDNIEIAGFDVVGVTHPNAFKYYDYELVDTTTIDNKAVYGIKVIPKKKLQPLFEGIVHVLDEEYALLNVKLVPNETVTFPPPIQGFDIDYEQQFNNYGQDFWLPVDMRVNGNIKIGIVGLRFPLIRFKQVSRISDYEVNIQVPDSLYEDTDRLTVDESADRNATDSLFIRRIESVPLTEDEQLAYEEIDSTATLEKAFKPSGFLARFVDTDEDEDGSGGGTGNFNPLAKVPGSFAPTVRYNRVDELFAGLRYEVDPVDQVELRFDGGYSTGYNEFGYGAGIRWLTDRRGWFRSRIGLDYKAHTVNRYKSPIYTPGFTVITNLIGEKDYFDYYRSEGVKVFTQLDIRRPDLTLQIGFKSEEHDALQTNTGYDILGRNRAPLPNPPVDEGRMNTLYWIFGYNLDEDYSYGVTGLKRIRFDIEHSKSWLGSDFGFTTYRTQIDWNFQTFYKRRLLPNTLDLKLTAGTFSGELPIQKFGIVDGSLGYFSPFGTLKTIRFRPYQGENYLSITAEHNFRSIPFELFGFREAANRNLGIIVFGGIGQSWIGDEREQELRNQFGNLFRESDGLHIEAGLSLNGVLGIFRIDFARRLDEPAFLVNVSVARLF